ncbi:MAG: sensor histidine kinase [Desulfovibrio sp.]|nr:sensor histidine kinase [Desulfovibrio sp.]
MSHTACMARLLASAVHDMRNILAVIRESAGLAQDITRFGDGSAASRKELEISLDEVRRQVVLAAQLAEGLEFMAQNGPPRGSLSQSGATGDKSNSCDLARVCRLFCRMAARQARAAQIRLECAENTEPVWMESRPMPVLHCLLDVLDSCVSVGGKVDLHLAATQQEGATGIAVRVSGGDNEALALSALTACLRPIQGMTCARLLSTGPGTFFLVLPTGEEG